MARTSITTTVEVELTVPMAAAWFAQLDDEQQVQFFVEVAAVAKATYPSDPNNQWWHVGRHLAECDCSSDGARDMLGNIVDYMRDKVEESTGRCSKCGYLRGVQAYVPPIVDAPAIDVHPADNGCAGGACGANSGARSGYCGECPHR